MARVRQTFEREISINISNGSQIDGIEVRADAVRSGNKVVQLDVELSWDGGVSWTSTGFTTGALPNAEQSFLLGSATETWGRTWTSTELTDANFRVRVTANSVENGKLGALDWVPVTVHYTEPVVQIDCLSPALCQNGVVLESSDVRAGFVSLQSTTLDVATCAACNWEVTAVVNLSTCPTGTTNCVTSALEFQELGGGYLAGGGVIFSGTGSQTFDADSRLNLSTLGDAPAGNYLFDVTYTVNLLP